MSPRVADRVNEIEGNHECCGKEREILINAIRRKRRAFVENRLITES